MQLRQLTSYWFPGIHDLTHHTGCRNSWLFHTLVAFTDLGGARQPFRLSNLSPADTCFLSGPQVKRVTIQMHPRVVMRTALGCFSRMQDAAKRRRTVKLTDATPLFWKSPQVSKLIKFTLVPRPHCWVCELFGYSMP